MSSDKLKEEILKIKGTSDIVNDPEVQKLLDASIERIDKNMKNESNKKKTNETMVILFAVSIKKKQH